jgi:hypothetical protein
VHLVARLIVWCFTIPSRSHTELISSCIFTVKEEIKLHVHKIQTCTRYRGWAKRQVNQSINQSINQSKNKSIKQTNKQTNKHKNHLLTVP